MRSLVLQLFLCFFFLAFAFADDWNVREHLASKTMYTPHSAMSEPPGSCEPAQINMVARHGARYPGKSDINKFSELARKMNEYATLYGPGFEWMGRWQNPYESIQDDILTYSGQVEHYNLAQRMLSRFPQLLNQTYQPYLFEMQSTALSRSGSSGTAFGYSLFQENGILPYPGGSFQPFFIYSNSLDQDTDLRFFDVCPNYINFVDDNTTAIEQANIYKKSNVGMAGYEVSRMIGVDSQWIITADELTLMYKGCGYDIAVYNITDNFCSLFETKEIGSPLEYYNDLKSYWQKSYGYPINYEMGCELFQEIVGMQEQYVTGANTNLRAKFRFAHAETVQPLVALLGLYKDETPLMADWTQQQIDDRLWKQSIVSPFAANVQFILYECDGYYTVKILVNEVEQEIPGCGIYCDFDTFTNLYNKALTDSYKELCFYGQTVCEYYC